MPSPGRSPGSNTFRSTTATSRRWATGWRRVRRSAATCPACSPKSASAASSPPSGWRPSSPKRPHTCFSSIATGSSKTTPGGRCRSDRVTFGGWRHGPWYALDGTHPEVQRHLEQVFRTMRQDWGVTYFKLDANFWGAIHGGRFHDPNAHARGSLPARHGGGPPRPGDAFLLGCNHPMWPSIGEIHGSRARTISSARGARQHHRAAEPQPQLAERPPVVERSRTRSVLERPVRRRMHVPRHGDLRDREAWCCPATISTKLPPARPTILRKLLPPTGVAAQFADDTLELGQLALPDRRRFCLFNWGETPRRVSVDLRPTEVASDFWTGAVLGRQAGPLAADVQPHSARLIEAAHV